MDSLDLRLIHALQLDGRAPFSRIAELLEVSDQTVARRYHRLRERAGLRVLGRPDARRLGQVEWLVRLQCVPGAALPVAEALARRADTQWVRLTSGGTEVVANLRADGERDRDALLLGRLPATRQVTAIGAHCLIHVFRGGRTGWPGTTSALTPEQAALLAPPAPQTRPDDQPNDRPDGPPVVLTAEDRRLLAELALDGRAPLARLATATGWHEAAVRRRLAALRATGVLYFDLDLDDRELGYGCPALLWLTVEPCRLAEAGRALAEHPEVAFAGATTGTGNLAASVLCRDVYALYDYLAGPVGALPGLRELASAPIIRTVKRTAAARV
ncbi:Lrp/AsnC family transcriptional regulator [Kitasatospora viridis]|uniref:DNA-binding Lrp family transcriptional regulator n=1 Tax=Kitasatospora viridis TaxID=281105 RepID=A0A561T7C9_9ACTN|nr:Lrp/AsnC family transcriptional regulator [Kitasatospora viridis]TWF83015.1 DNA-binding Lrp family transcriptional regulator [Kitasatospora viridis]